MFVLKESQTTERAIYPEIKKLRLILVYHFFIVNINTLVESSWGINF
ncbi:MAG: hypothetical protein ACTS5A_03630 [Candidatus Hodgkinia cicadicola]